MDLFNVIDWNFCFARIWREYGNKSSIWILTFVEPGCIRGVTGSAGTGWNLNQENVKSTEKHSATLLLHVTRREQYSANILHIFCKSLTPCDMQGTMFCKYSTNILNSLSPCGMYSTIFCKYSTTLLLHVTHRALYFANILQFFNT